MNSRQLYSQFCRECYVSTGGWIPMMPLHATLELGDFGQIRRGQFKRLGNINQLQLVQDFKHTDDVALNPWRLASGIEKTASTDNQENLWRTQTLVFQQQGDFIFQGAQPKARFISRWTDFKPSITLKLTQNNYSFRDVCVITAINHVSEWGLAIAGADNAQLEIAAQTSAADSDAMLSHPSAIALQSRHIASFETGAGRAGHFFKAKKLVLSDQKTDEFITQLLQQHPAIEADILTNWLSSDLINLVAHNDLNPNTCLDFFDWVDVTLDDFAL